MNTLSRQQRASINTEYVLLMVLGALALILGLQVLNTAMLNKHIEVAEGLNRLRAPQVAGSFAETPVTPTDNGDGMMSIVADDTGEAPYSITKDGSVIDSQPTPVFTIPVGDGTYAIRDNSGAVSLPVVVTMSSVTSTATIRPTSDVALGSWTERNPTTPTTNWDKVADEVADGDTTHIRSYSLGDALFGHGGSIPANAHDIIVETTAVARDWNVNSVQCYGVINVSGTSFASSSSWNPAFASYQPFKNSWALNPATGEAWAPDDITNLSFGIRMGGSEVGRRIAVTQVYMSVTYTQTSPTFN